MQKKQVLITVKKDGTYSVKPQEGFSGTSCVEQTKDLEILLGGEMVSQEKTSEYYDGDTPDIDLNLKR